VEYADACFQALIRQGLGDKISLGGALGLSYYIEYRPTHDVDAWWSPSAGEVDRRKVVSLLQETLNRYGAVRIRIWGEVVSVDLEIARKVVFSFQIASRNVQLKKSEPAPWPRGMLLDSFADLVAAKMVALVERGAPRDFRDIYALCNAGLMDARSCWNLWHERRKLAGDDTAPAREHAWHCSPISSELSCTVHSKRYRIRRKERGLRL
jgi:hypothetical protein